MDEQETGRDLEGEGHGHIKRYYTMCYMFLLRSTPESDLCQCYSGVFSNIDVVKCVYITGVQIDIFVHFGMWGGMKSGCLFSEKYHPKRHRSCIKGAVDIIQFSVQKTDETPFSESPRLLQTLHDGKYIRRRNGNNSYTLKSIPNSVAKLTACRMHGSEQKCM